MSTSHLLGWLGSASIGVILGVVALFKYFYDRGWSAGFAYRHRIDGLVTPGTEPSSIASVSSPETR